MNNFLVYKSSAGSGKTYTLMVEYLSLALKYPSAYKHILAITFTNKAANEIKQRVTGNLKKLAVMVPGEVPEKEKELVERLTGNTGLTEEQLFLNAGSVLSSVLHYYSDFAVSTIDSFMHRVIRSFAFDLRLSMNFEVELDTDGLLNAAVDELISKVGKDEDLTELLKNYVIRRAENDEGWDIGNDLKKSAKALFKEKMSGLVPALEKKVFTGKDFEKICRAVEALNKDCRAAGAEALSLIGGAGLDPCDFIYGSKGIGGYFTKAFEGKYADPENKYVRDALDNGKWFKNGSAQSVSAIEPQLVALATRIDKLQKEVRFLTLIRNNFHSTLLLKKINDELQFIREQRNLVSINDFNSLIAGVVRDQPVPFIYMRVGEKFRHFMIDEFQDTSGMQWENLLPLIENSLSDSRLNMIVGDGKQAIYRFKNGDAEQFVGLPELRNASGNPYVQQRQNLLAAEYNEKHLLMNYRSRQEIVEFNNDFFAFAADKFVPAHRNFYTDVVQQYKPDNRGGLVQFDFVPKDVIITRVLDLVEEARTAGYQYGDITVLCRANKDAVSIAEALQTEGIRVVSSESLLLTASPEVNFLVNWIAFMANPDDKASVMGLVEYLLATYPALAEKFLPRRTGRKYLYEILESLEVQIYSHTFDALSFYDSIELMVRRFRLGSMSPVYIRFFLDQVLDFTRRESSGAAGFLEYWGENCGKLSVSMGQHKDAVQIMTVHKSKGLDFPVVIYAFPDHEMNKGDLTWDSVRVEIPGTDAMETLEMPLVFRYSKDLLGTPFEDDYMAEADKVKLDKFNLYYVAFTRASERLYVVLEENPNTANDLKSLNQLAAVYLQQRNEGNRFGDGNRVEGKYHAEAAITETEHTESNQGQVNIAFKAGDWRDKIILARRSPLDWKADANDGGRLLAGKLDYGKLVHRVLSEINTFEDTETALDYVLSVSEDFTPESREMVRNTLSELENMPGIRQFFNGGKVVKEQDILTPEGESYRPDRIVMDDEVTWVIDFKTGLPSDKHQTQVKQYMELMKSMGYPEPSGCILYLGESPGLVMVKLTDHEAISI